MNRMKTQGVLKGGWNGYVTVKPSILSELLWWSTQLRHNHPAPIRVEGQIVTICTDASPQGWGGWFQERQDPNLEKWYVHGKWEEEVAQTSNYHEMMAVFFCVKHFLSMGKLREVRRINLLTDSTTVMYDINRQRGAVNLLRPLQLIANLLFKHQIQMTARHLPGVENGIADSLSRLSRSGDYSLEPKVYWKGIQILGVSPQIDLFATRFNKKCQRYVSLETDAEAAGRDAFSLGWRNFFCFIHPPIPLILRCVRKVIQDQAFAVMVVPSWVGQPWSTLLKRITIRHVELGKSIDILQPGAWMQRTGLQLPPGTLRMCLVQG
jgi:ribonuclease HI